VIDGDLSQPAVGKMKARVHSQMAFSPSHLKRQDKNSKYIMVLSENQDIYRKLLIGIHM